MWEQTQTIMKNLITPHNTFLLFCLTSIFAFTACGTTGMQRSQEVQSTMETVDNDIKSIIVQLDAINSSLAELTKPNQADLKKAFDLFSEETSEIKEMRENFSKHAAQMEASGKAYFEQWDKNSQQYDNPDIQKQSNERREALGETYDKISQNNVGVKDAFKTYVSDVNEIEEFLSNDLTSEGIESIEPIAEEVVDNGSHLKNELRNLQSAIEQARIEMRQN